ncbi:MAG: thiol-disulfide oxidoreductase [Methylomonas sp.]|nr:MAG: thiol-disulfide oxidoreductase [Methylomonas sp.]
MYKFFHNKIQQLYTVQVSSTGIGIFRILYGIITFQEIIFLFYFRHLIFDPIPYIDVEYPMIPFFLCIWGVFSIFLIFGYRYQLSAFACYFAWIVFVNFTPMQRDFDGGFDSFMIGAGFFLLFMPGKYSLSIDNLRDKLTNPFIHYSSYKPHTVSILSYYFPIIICLGFLYFDSAIHKLFAPHWRNGLGSWLPATHPYYISAIDMSPLLNQEIFQKIIGYTIFLFQFTFLFFFNHHKLWFFYLLVGVCLHLGITLTLNIYPFGLAMLSFYALLVPFQWWKYTASTLQFKTKTLVVLFDNQCPLCCRTVLFLSHFDIFKSIDFLPVNLHARTFPEFNSISDQLLLTDLYSIDLKTRRTYSGLNTYIKILFDMRYTAFIALILKIPGIYHYAKNKYRKIADSRVRMHCSDTCAPSQNLTEVNLYNSFFNLHESAQTRVTIQRLTKVFIFFFFLQLNSTLHYGFFYRVNLSNHLNPFFQPLIEASNSILLLSQTFLGITPHALYLHDHLKGYDRIFALTYSDQQGIIHWLPFIDNSGRLLAPHWGRVHSMWANIAVTPHINRIRLEKFIMKITAFWAAKLNLELGSTTFFLLEKPIQAPDVWVNDLRSKNIAQPWHQIGTIQWRNGRISYEIPTL